MKLKARRRFSSDEMADRAEREVSEGTVSDQCQSYFKGYRCVNQEGHKERQRDRMDISTIMWRTEQEDKRFTQAELDLAVAEAVVNEDDILHLITSDHCCDDGPCFIAKRRTINCARRDALLNQKVGDK